MVNTAEFTPKLQYTGHKENNRVATYFYLVRNMTPPRLESKPLLQTWDID